MGSVVSYLPEFEDINYLNWEQLPIGDGGVKFYRNKRLNLVVATTKEKMRSKFLLYDITDVHSISKIKGFYVRKRLDAMINKIKKEKCETS